MNRKVFLISLLAVGLAVIIGSALYVRLGPRKRLSQENRQVKDDIAAHQGSESRMEQETGQAEEGIQPEKGTVASGPSEVVKFSPENGSDAEQFPETPTDSGVSGDGSQTTQEKARVSEPSGVEDSESIAEALPRSMRKEGRSLPVREDKPAKGSPTVVRRSAIALAVENREPKEICERVSVRQGRVYCWVHVINGEGTKITVRWVMNGKKLWETYLSVGSNNWRTWAYMSLRPGMMGPARAEILNQDGELLKRESFEITG